MIYSAVLCKHLKPTLIFLCFASTEPRFVVIFKVALSNSSSGFQSFSLDTGCFFTHVQSSPVDYSTLTYESFKHNKAPNSRDEPVNL